MTEQLLNKNEKLTINVLVAGRTYSLSIDRGAEYQEEIIRKAADKINKKIEKYRERFAGHDTLDFLAMSSLQLVKELIAEQNDNDIEPLIERIKDLNEEIDELIEE